MKANRASNTARLIARSTIFTAQDFQRKRFVPEQSAKLCESFVEPHSIIGKRFATRLQTSSLARSLVAISERQFLPGIQLHYALRKRFLEEQTRHAISCGIRQVVILGAGFDTLGLRLHEEFPDTHFIEADHPATQAAKLKVLATRHTPNSNISFLALDLAAQSIAKQLLSHTFYAPDEDALFIAEGLLMYLERRAVDELFSFVRDHSGARSLFAFSFMEQQGDGQRERIGFRNSSHAVNAWLRLRGESFKWSIGVNRLPQYLRAFGFNAREIATHNTFQNRYLAPENLAHLPLAVGECLCIAARA
jgi:methyltransferase (TIGR00027 family)